MMRPMMSRLGQMLEDSWMNSLPRLVTGSSFVAHYFCFLTSIVAYFIRLANHS